MLREFGEGEFGGAEAPQETLETSKNGEREEAQERQETKERAAEYVFGEFQEVLARKKQDQMEYPTYEVGGEQHEVTEYCDMIVCKADAELAAAKEVLATIQESLQERNASQEEYYREKMAAKLVHLLQKKKELAYIVADIEHESPALAGQMKGEVHELDTMTENARELFDQVKGGND